MFILGQLVLPSFSLLYSLDEFDNFGKLFIRAVGNQWYWDYEYREDLSVNKMIQNKKALTATSYEFESYMLVDELDFKPVQRDFIKWYKILDFKGLCKARSEELK